jgi:Protein of unknown function (DUF3105)
VTLGDKNRFYALDTKVRPERAVHNLEHGYVVAWYDASLPAAQVTQLQQLAKDPSLSELLVVGWWQSPLPQGKHIVLTSWGRTDRCASVSPTVVRSFYAAHVNSSLAPEVGSGAAGGDLFPPDTVITERTATPTPSTSGSASPTKKK